MTTTVAVAMAVTAMTMMTTIVIEKKRTGVWFSQASTRTWVWSHRNHLRTQVGHHVFVISELGKQRKEDAWAFCSASLAYLVNSWLVKKTVSKNIKKPGVVLGLKVCTPTAVNIFEKKMSGALSDYLILSIPFFYHLIDFCKGTAFCIQLLTVKLPT